MEKRVYNRIIVNPKIMVGKLVIKGTRTPVDMIVKLIAQRMTISEILDDYPNLNREDVKAAFYFRKL